MKLYQKLVSLLVAAVMAARADAGVHGGSRRFR